MSKAVKYTNGLIGSERVIPDLLPRPEELVLREEAVKVTIAVSKRSVEFFKAEARRHDTQHQKMIRRLLEPVCRQLRQPCRDRSRQNAAPAHCCLTSHSALPCRASERQAWQTLARAQSHKA